MLYWNGGIKSFVKFYFSFKKSNSFSYMLLITFNGRIMGKGDERGILGQTS